MNEQSERTMKIFNDLMENGVDFIVEKYPVVCSEIINYGLFVNSTCVIAFTLLYILFMILIYLGFKHSKDRDDKPIIIMMAILGHAPLIGAIISFYYLAYVYMCPNMYIYGELMKTFR